MGNCNAVYLYGSVPTLTFQVAIFVPQETA